MQSTNLAHQLIQAPRLGIPKRSLRTLYSQAQMHQAVHRERCRSDRSGQEFSLVLLRAPRSIGPSRTTLRLAHLVCTRSRGTDDVGWFDQDTVCAILPDTSPDGAVRFIDQVTAGLRDVSIKPIATVYTYPSQWPDGENDMADDGSAASTNVAIRHHAKSARPKPTEPVGPIRSNDLMPFVIRGVSETLGEQTGPLADEAASRLIQISDATLSTKALESLLTRSMPFWKRAMDVLGAIVGLVMFLPLLILIGVAIRLDSRGPVIFKQRRAGLGGKPFYIYKFRTMCNDAERQKAALRAISEQDGPAFKLTNDPRITRVGQLLRKTSLDELPQFWNVIRGEMSLVGPRPLPVDEQNGCTQWQRARIDVTPGLTCIWQITGRSEVSFSDWVRMDVKYIHRRTFWHDLKILFQTIPAVLLRRGAR